VIVAPDSVEEVGVFDTLADILST